MLGVKILSQAEIGETVYPFLGPGRSAEDVEHARAALENAYHNKGFQTVSVAVPPQEPRRGVVYLQVTEAKVGRLRVKGSRYYNLDDIKRRAPSMAEGTVPNFSAVTRDIVALNTLPDRRITPSLRAGVEPGTVDIDLEVKDTFPLHGSLEVNNRYSSNTTELRVNGSLSYNNLWQLGHSVGASFQVAPERPEDAKVFSGYYLARFAEAPWFSLTLQGTKQDSNVSTLGGAAVAGKGEMVGLRAMATLPARKNFYHSLSLGIDYKHFAQSILFGGAETASPVTYYPVNAIYTASWMEKGAVTDLNAGVTFSFRGAGSDVPEFDARRYKSDGGFIYLRGDLSHTHDLPVGFVGYGKVQGQLTGQSLVDSEQFSGGGLGTVRGYLESEVVGDNAILGTAELRTPSLLDWAGKRSELRLHAFVEGGVLTVNNPLPEQLAHFNLASIGFGARLRLLDYLNGSVDFALPLISQNQTQSHDLLMTFRLWADF